MILRVFLKKSDCPFARTTTFSLKIHDSTSDDPQNVSQKSTFISYMIHEFFERKANIVPQAVHKNYVKYPRL